MLVHTQAEPPQFGRVAFVHVGHALPDVHAVHDPETHLCPVEHVESALQTHVEPFHNGVAGGHDEHADGAAAVPAHVPHDPDVHLEPAPPQLESRLHTHLFAVELQYGVVEAHEPHVVAELLHAEHTPNDEH